MRNTLTPRIARIGACALTLAVVSPHWAQAQDKRPSPPATQPKRKGPTKKKPPLKKPQAQKPQPKEPQPKRPQPKEEAKRDGTRSAPEEEKPDPAKERDGEERDGEERASTKENTPNDDATGDADPSQAPPPDAPPDAATRAAATPDATELANDGQHRVVSTASGRVVVDLTSTDGARKGSMLEVWRTVHVRHPLSGKALADQFLVGTLRLTVVGESLSFAEPIEMTERARPGDVVKVFGPASEPPDDDDDEAKVPMLDRELAAVEMMWLSLRGASVARRILTYYAFVKKYPKSRYAVAIWEEAMGLRRLFDGDIPMPLPPPRPKGASSSIAHASAGDAAVDFDALEKRFAARLAKEEETPEEEWDVAYTHDGGFFRFSLGAQLFNGAVDIERLQSPHFSSEYPASVGLAGGAASFDLAWGVAVVPGFLVGLHTSLTVGSATVQLSDLGRGYEDEVVDGVVMPYGGLMIDMYPDPEFGLHFLANVGMTGATWGSGGSIADPAFFGFAYGGGIGLEGWVSEQWSIGVQLRVDGAHMFSDEEMVAEGIGDLSLASPSLQLAFTYQ